MVGQQPATPLTVLFIGEANTDEFRAAVHWLRLRSHFAWSRSVRDAERLLASDCDNPVSTLR